MSSSKIERPVIDAAPYSNAAHSLLFLKTHIKTELLGKIRTGDPIYDTMIAFAIMSSQDTLISYMSYLKDFMLQSPRLFWGFLRWIIKRWKFRKRPRRGRIEKNATVQYITDGREINTLFEPVMWYINSLTDTKTEPQVLLETTKNNPDVTQHIPRQRSAKIFFLDHKIKYSIRTELVTIYAERDHKRENIIIDLRTKTNESRPVDIFQQFSEMCQKKHEEFSKKKKWGQLIYRNEKGVWKSQKSKTSRKLETVVLKQGQMKDIMADINEFTHKEEWYLSRDVPYTRRYMFWGVPGTGKSSCIKALACYTKRHIHYLVLSDVDSDADLFKLVEQVNFQETILVIEDIDCASRITHERDESDKVDDEDEIPKSALTLAGLLNAIDGGMVENHGQIMVMTTNHPEKLDAALIRPGRVDRKYEFGLCDNYQIKGLFHNFFERYPDKEHSFPQNKISPAAVTSVLLQYKKDPDEAWDQVITQLGG